MSGLIRKLWRIAAGVVAGIVILLAVAIGLVRLALVQVPEYRDQIEGWAGEALGWPVEIGTMDARLGWRGPELRFSDARVLTRDGERTLVVAATGSMLLDGGSLLRGQPRPGAVSLGGVELRIERTVQGRWRLLGEDGPVLPERTSARGERAVELPRLADLPSAKLSLEDVRVEIEDLRRRAGPWLLHVNSLELQLGDGQISVAAAGRLPDSLGADLAVSFVVSELDERGRPYDWTAGLSFNALDLNAMGAALGRAEQLPARGMVDGNLSAAASDGGLARVAGDLVARNLIPASAPAPAPGEEAAPAPQDAVTESTRAELRAPELPYEHLGAAFEWTRTPLGWEARFNDLDVERGGRRWVSPHAALVFEDDAGVRRIEARADLLELEDLAPAASWLPANARDIVMQLAPAGTMRALELHLDLPATEGQPPELYVDVHFEHLSVAPWERAPGVSNISGSVSGDLHAGSARLDGRDSSVDLPWMFRAPLELELLEATLEWSRDEQGRRLLIPELELANADAAVTGRLELLIPPGEASPQLEIDAVARNVRLAAAPRYLPVNRLPERVIEWLDGALRAGRVDEARFELRGATREFPFREGDGLFKAEFDIADGELAFDDGWPSATGLDAAVRFENEGLWADVRAARLLDVGAAATRVAIPDLKEGRLVIEGRADGRLAAFRELVLAADLLERILGAGLEPAAMTAGQVSADVKLDLPLARLAEARAQVELQVSDGVIAYGFLGEPLRAVNARIGIDNARVTARGATATLAGSPVTADVSVGDDGAVRVDGRGRIDAPGLARVLRVPLDAWTRGEGDWTGRLQFPVPRTDAPFKLEISSQLEGFAIDLPAPFRKAADEARDLVVRASFPDARLMDGELEWNESLRIAARVDRAGPEPVFLPIPGALAGEPAGLVFSGAIASFDLAEWLAMEWPEDIETDGVRTIMAGGRLLIGELSGPSLAATDVLFDLSRGADRWIVDLAAEHAAGHVEIPFALYGNRPVEARLDRLWLDPGPPRDPSASPEAPDSKAPPAMMYPGRVPPLDIEIDDLRFGAIRFGRVSARVLHEGDGFQLIGLEGVGEGFIIQAEGRSRLSDAVDESHLALRIQSDNVGATLDFMGFRRSMEARQGLFEARVEWQGGLRSDWLSAFEGDASISIRDGRLVGVEPGAGRVFGLLSLQALPRRMALDFKDVFGEGTSFDRIAGDFRFAGGNALTDNLVMEGPAADMVVIGRTGLVARDYDQTAVIGVDLGRTFPVAGAVVGGPAVGAALFLLAEIFRKPFQAQITYRLTGPWENPVVEKLSAGTLPPSAPAEGPTPPQGQQEGN